MNGGRMRRSLPSRITPEMLDQIAAEDILSISDSERCSWAWKLGALQHAREWLLADPFALRGQRVVVKHFGRDLVREICIVARVHYGAQPVAGEIVFEIGRSDKSRELGFDGLGESLRAGLARVLQQRID